MQDTAAELLEKHHCREVSWDVITGLGAGSAPCRMAEAADLADALYKIKELKSAGFRLQPIGGGMNYAGSDVPLHNMVFLKPARAGFSVLRMLDENRIYAGSACTPGEIIRFALRHNLGGASGLTGIPGTLGGALAMNAGAKGVSFSDIVETVSFIPLDTVEPEEVTLPSSALAFGYRKSPVLRDAGFITGAVLHFKKVDPAEEQKLIDGEMTRRRTTPKGRSAGSVFRNPPEGPAGKFLEECGCKGMECGSYQVSQEHANWIIRKPDSPAGKTSDLLALIHEMRNRVEKTHHIQLIPEVRFANMADEIKKSPLKVMVLKGGCSSEREVSLESGKAIANALREKGYDVTEYDIRELALTPEMKNYDIIWPVLHGGFGEDGRIQKLLEDAKIPFVGSGSAACALVMDKVASKKVMDANGIPNAKYAVIDPKNCAIPSDLKFPLVVKPVSEGSTFGLSVVDTPSDWQKALDLVFKYGETALVEEFFSGVEVTIGVLSGKALPIIEIRYSAKVYDYDAKYLHKTCETQYLCGAPSVPSELQKKLSDEAVRFYELTGSRDVLRVDMMVNVTTGKYCVLEGNAIPGCTANSLVPKAAKAMGLTFPAMCAMELEGAAARFGL